MALMSKEHMRKAESKRPGTIRRLARWLKMKHLDEMSDRQVIRLLDWYFKRRDKKMRGMIAW